MKIWKIKKEQVKEILKKKGISFVINISIHTTRLERLCVNYAKKV